MVSRLCDDGVQGRDGRCVENSSCFQIFLFVPVCILLLGSAAGLICFPLIFTCLPVLFICLPALDCCGRLCLAILCLPALDVAGSSCRVFRFEKHKLFGVYGGVMSTLNNCKPPQVHQSKDLPKTKESYTAVGPKHFGFSKIETLCN